MGTVIGGSRGGMGAPHAGLDAGHVRALLAGTLSCDALLDRMQRAPFPRTISVVVNNGCTFHCAHCYLQLPQLLGRALSDGEWSRVLESILNNGPDLLAFSGKEVLFGDRGPELLTLAGRYREQSGGPTRLGLITNGTLVGEHRQQLVEAGLDYLDISIEGLPEDNDAVRGAGAFAKAWPGIEWASRIFGPRFFATMTVQARNFLSLPQVIPWLAAAGVSNIAVGFYVPLPYTDSRLALQAQQLAHFFASLRRLREIELASPFQLVFDLDLMSGRALEAFLGSEWFDPEAIAEDDRGNVFIAHELDNGLGMAMRFAPYPVGPWKASRVTVEGLYLGGEDTIDTTRYALKSYGNVRDFGYDVGALNRASLSSDEFTAMVATYFAAVVPRLRAAVAGSRSRSKVA